MERSDSAGKGDDDPIFQPTPDQSPRFWVVLAIGVIAAAVLAAIMAVKLAVIRPGTSASAGMHVEHPALWLWLLTTAWWAFCYLSWRQLRRVGYHDFLEKFRFGCHIVVGMMLTTLALYLSIASGSWQ